MHFGSVNLTVTLGPQPEPYAAEVEGEEMGEEDGMHTYIPLEVGYCAEPRLFGVN